jgi:hypothetical protein
MALTNYLTSLDESENDKQVLHYEYHTAALFSLPTKEMQNDTAGRSA